MKPTVRLWDCGKGKVNVQGKGSLILGDIICIDVQCAQAKSLLWALVGRVVSFQLSVCCFVFVTPLKEVKN